MKNHFEKFGVMVDNSRNAVMKPEMVKKMLDLLSELGFNTFMLYTEDTYEVNNQPYFGHLRGRYSKQEMKELDQYAISKGIELIPCIQTLAHLATIMRWPQYCEILDKDDVLCVGKEKTYALIDDMFATISECFTSRIVNVGMDEAEMMGLGRYYRENGHCDRSELFVQHLNRVAEIGKKYGFRLCMWGDMFFRLAGSETMNPTVKVSDEIKKKIPDNVDLIYWDYYSTNYSDYNDRIKKYSKVKSGIWFAGGIWTWTGVTPQNTYSIHATKPAIEACVDNKIKSVVLTMWGDNGGECSRFAGLPGLFYASELAKGNDNMDSIKEKFETRYGIAFDDFMLIDLPDSMRDISRCTNPEKYLLYNDFFMGVYDGNIPDNVADGYKKCSHKLEKMIDHPEWGWLFRTQHSLCKVLEIKSDLGIRTRRAYLEKNMVELQNIILDYDELEKRLEVFYLNFEAQWMRENKPHGFDVQDIRLGGVMRRLKHCRSRLQQFINGQVDVIEELDEPVLDIAGKGADLSNKRAKNSITYQRMCTVNPI